jgi:hypothetical protein
MSRTIVNVAEAEITRNAIDAVEWLVAIWELTEPEGSRSANPDLVALLQTPSVLAHPVVQTVARVRAAERRDRAIKAVVSGCYGDATALPDLCATLGQFVDRIGDLLDANRLDAIQQARGEAQRRAEALCGAWDPVGDLTPLVGERVPARIVLAPSVFLPLPNAGRHGVLVRRPDDSSIVHLHFGFALGRSHFSANRTWLLGGAWHYAIRLYLDRHWPTIAQRLADRSDLGRAVRDLIAAPRTAPASGPMPDERPWTDVMAAHLTMAIKCVLSHRLGLADGFHRVASRAEGCVLAPWFEEWLEAGLAEHVGFARHLATLPEAFAAQQSRWESLAVAEASTPLTANVNFRIWSPEARRATVVVPDEWTDDAAAAAVAGWSGLSLPVQRYGEWMRSSAGDASPVIAIGEPERNPLVRRVLDQWGLSLTAFALEAPSIVATSLPGFVEAEWCLAVAVTGPESAAHVRIPALVKQTRPYVVFDGGVAVDASELRRPTPLIRPEG